MDMKQEIFMRLVVEQCDPHAMGWNFSDLYQLACDAEKYYQQKELERTRKALDDKQIKKAAIKYAEGRCEYAGEDECDYVVSRCIDRQIAAAFEAGAEWAIGKLTSVRAISAIDNAVSSADAARFNDGTGTLKEGK